MKGDKEPRAKSGRDKAAAEGKSEIMKGDKLGKQGGSGSQERNHEGTQAWETRRQGQPRAKSRKETSLGDQAAGAAKSEIKKGDKLGRQGSGSQEWNHKGRPGGSDSQFPQSVTQPLRSKNPIASSYLGK